jgi:Domain of unknown function (DUF3303)
MLFMISYSFNAQDRNVVQERFKKTGGLPGPGATMLGRWHDVGGNRGFALAESNDSVAIGKWMQEWTDFLEFEVTPVNTDEDVMKVLGT